MAPSSLCRLRAAAFLSLLAALPAASAQVAIEPARLPASVGAQPWARPRALPHIAPYSRLELTPSFRAPALTYIPAPQVMASPGVAAPVFAPGAVSFFQTGLAVQEALSRKDAPDSQVLSSFYEGNRRALPAVYLAATPAPAESGSQLLTTLHKTTGRGYRAHDYQDASHYMFGVSDNIVRNGVRGVVDAYSGIFVPGTSPRGDDYPEKGDPNHDGWVDREGMNVEHTWPQSFFDKSLPMRSDLHHLLPTFHHPNGIRSNLPFGEVKGKPEYSNDAGAKMGGGVFEPPDFSKGQVARAVLYFYTRYYDRNITQGAYNHSFFLDRVEMFLRWNREHPPAAEELRRNDLVEKYQGNRNPFIDDPALADRVGVGGFGSRMSGRSSLARGRRRAPRSAVPSRLPAVSYSLN